MSTPEGDDAPPRAGEALVASEAPATMPAVEPPGAEAERVALLAAALRADSGDLESYERLLVASLADSLPSGVIEIERDRSFGERLAGRPGKVAAIRVHLGDQSLELRTHHGRLEGSVTTNVRGVAISHKAVALDEWTALFAHHLARFAADNARARAALERLLGL